MDIIEIFNWISGVVMIASAIAASTPSKWDNDILDKYVAPFVDALALNILRSKEPRVDEE